MQMRERASDKRDKSSVFIFCVWCVCDSVSAFTARQYEHKAFWLSKRIISKSSRIHCPLYSPLSGTTRVCSVKTWPKRQTPSERRVQLCRREGGRILCVKVRNRGMKCISRSSWGCTTTGVNNVELQYVTQIKLKIHASSLSLFLWTQWTCPELRSHSSFSSHFPPLHM